MHFVLHFVDVDFFSVVWHPLEAAELGNCGFRTTLSVHVIAEADQAGREVSTKLLVELERLLVNKVLILENVVVRVVFVL